MDSEWRLCHVGEPYFNHTTVQVIFAQGSPSDASAVVLSVNSKLITNPGMSKKTTNMLFVWPLTLTCFAQLWRLLIGLKLEPQTELLSVDDDPQQQVKVILNLLTDIPPGFHMLPLLCSQDIAYVGIPVVTNNACYSVTNYDQVLKLEYQLRNFLKS